MVPERKTAGSGDPPEPSAATKRPAGATRRVYSTGGRGYSQDYDRVQRPIVTVRLTPLPRDGVSLAHARNRVSQSCHAAALDRSSRTGPVKRALDDIRYQRINKGRL